MATPRCEEYEDLRKYFMRENTPDTDVLHSISSAYVGLLRLAKSLETELILLKG